MLDESGLAFVPLSAIFSWFEQPAVTAQSPGVEEQVPTAPHDGQDARSVQGERDAAGSSSDADYLDTMREVLSAAGTRGLLLRGTEGEPYANPKRRPRIEYLHETATSSLKPSMKA